LGARKQDEWETPKYIFDWATQGYSINLDVCASAKNYKASPYISKKQDGLKESWAGYRCWMNPPFSDIGSWVTKAVGEVWHNKGTEVVALLPANTDTKWFHSICGLFPIILLGPGRISFELNGKSQPGNPRGSMLVFFDNEPHSAISLKAPRATIETVSLPEPPC